MIQFVTGPSPIISQSIIVASLVYKGRSDATVKSNAACRFRGTIANRLDSRPNQGVVGGGLGGFLGDVVPIDPVADGPSL